MIRGMLTIYRRHSRECPHKTKGRVWHRCQCPIWIDGSLRAERLNYSLKTNNWTAAAERARCIELGIEPRTAAAVPVREACEQYLRDCQARKLSTAALKKYRSRLVGATGIHRERQEKRSTRSLCTWCETVGLSTIGQLTPEHLTAYRAEWKDSGITSRKRLETLRAFFTWCVARSMVSSNPAKALRPAKATAAITLPYSSQEIISLIAACEFEHTSDRGNTQLNRRTLRSLILVLRYTGLRISDAMRLSDEHIQGGKVTLRTHKTGQRVMVPVPEFLIRELSTTPRRGARWFWDGEADIDSTVEDWRGRLRRAAKRAGVANPGFHRFRDTFATELLSNGASIEHVAELLGHASTKITFRHYSPWVAQRQAALEADVKKALANDPLAQFSGLLHFGDVAGLEAAKQ
jgi:integrase/recombinase XerD